MTALKTEIPSSYAMQGKYGFVIVGTASIEVLPFKFFNPNGWQECSVQEFLAAHQSATEFIQKELTNGLCAVLDEVQTLDFA